MQAVNPEARDPVAIVSENPAVIFVGGVAFDDFYAELRERLLKVGDDTSSDKRRKEIASAAAKAAKAKTAIDGAGKELNAAKRREIDEVDAVRRRVRERLDALKAEIRRPLDQWEEQEKARVEAHQALVQRINEAGRVHIDDGPDAVRERLEWLRGLDVSERELQEFAPAGETARETAIATLTDALARLEREEKERAELEALRREKEDRERREAAERVERERKEREDRVAREEAERKAEAERLAKEAAEKAAEEARREAERKAEDERQRLIREHEEREKARAAEERRQREEEERRVADRAHRGAVLDKAAEAIMEAGGIDRDRARKIADAIASGAIPRVTIRF